MEKQSPNTKFEYKGYSILGRQLKLIWDFRGPAALKTAEHHEIHLKEFISIENIKAINTGYTELNELHSIAYLVVNEENMITVRDSLKPHRGELYVEK